MNKHLYRVSGLVLSVALITPVFASAQTATDLTGQIQSLMSQISSLEVQLHTLLQSAAPSSTPPMGGEGGGAWMPPSASTTPPVGGGMNVCPQIARDLSMGARGSDVSELQGMLIDDGFLSASSTMGFFGPLTAHALGEFQTHFGITASSTGFFGSLTRNFLHTHCGGYGNAGTGSGAGSWGGGQTGGGPGGWFSHPASSTSGMPCMTPYYPESDASASGTASTNVIIMHPCGGGNPVPMPGRFMPMGSSTPQTPCPQSSIQNGSSVAAVAAALFMPHAILPGMMGAPCGNGGASGVGQSQQQ